MAPKRGPQQQLRARARAKCVHAPTPPKVQRQADRRAALRSLNALATDLGLSTLPVKTVGAKVDRFLKRLQARCTTSDSAERLRAAALQWQGNGGFVRGTVAPAAAAGGPPAAAGDGDGADRVAVAPRAAEGAAAQDADAEADETTATLPRHKVIVSTYRLESRAFMATYNSRSFTAEDWLCFKRSVKAAAVRYGATGWAACWEESMHAGAPSRPAAGTAGHRVWHGHAYYMWEDGEGVRMRDTSAFVFQGVKPRIDACSVTAPRQWKLSALHGMWYVTVMKAGTRDSATNMQPWEAYTPQAPWLVALWDQHKLSHEQYEELSADFRSGHAARMRDLEAVRRTERAAAVRRHVTSELLALDALPPLEQPKAFSEVERFVDCFRKPMRRRPFLVIIGATGTGKSELGRHILRKRLGPILSVDKFLEVTVGCDTALDLSNFDVSSHAGVLLDGVADAQTLSDNRESLQGRAKADTGGRSNTMVYSYPYTLCNRGVVVTMDLAAKNLDFFHTHHWLSVTDNAIVLTLSGPTHEARV